MRKHQSVYSQFPYAPSTTIRPHSRDRHLRQTRRRRLLHHIDSTPLVGGSGRHRELQPHRPVDQQPQPQPQQQKPLSESQQAQFEKSILSCRILKRLEQTNQRNRKSPIAHFPTKKSGGDFCGSPPPSLSLRIIEVIPASRREALYGRSSCPDAPSECHRASFAVPL